MSERHIDFKGGELTFWLNDDGVLTLTATATFPSLPIAVDGVGEAAP